MFSLVNLLYPVWLASVFQQRARQIGGFLTARTKYMTGAPPANVEVKPPQTQNCPGAHTGAENLHFGLQKDFLRRRKMIPI